MSKQYVDSEYLEALIDIKYRHRKLEQENKKLRECIDECLSLVAQREPSILTHKQAADSVLDIMFRCVEESTSKNMKASNV